MIKGKTKSGFKYEVNSDSLNDYELIEIIAEVDINPLLLPKLIVKLLGVEQKDRLIEHIKSNSENGIATAEAMGNEVAEIFDNVKLKNS